MYMKIETTYIEFKKISSQIGLFHGFNFNISKINFY
jgi:hypothetical protein